MHTCITLLLLAALSASASAQLETRTTAPASAASCPIQPATLPSDAWRAYAAGDFGKAESLFAAQAASAPSDDAFLGLVKSQLQQDKLAEARESADRAVAALPKSGQSVELVGEVLLRSGEITPAVSAFGRSLALDKCAPRIHFAAARLQELKSNHLTAAREYAYAHSLAPADPELAAAAFDSMDPTQPDKKSAALKDFLASNPLLPPAELDRLKVSQAIVDQHLTCTPAGSAQPAKLPLLGLMLYGTHARSFGLKVRVNNADLPLLELDSGVAGIVLNPGDAKKAGVHPLTASTHGVYYAVADHIKIGNLDYDHCPVRVAPAATLANANSLVGTDFFRDHLIHIDYVLKTLTLTPYTPPATAGLTDHTIPADEKDWTPVFISGSDVLVPTLVNKQGPFLFLLDSGSNISIFSPVVSKAVLFKHKDANLNLHGTSGSIVKVLQKFGGSDDDHAVIYGPNGKLIDASTPLKVPILQFANNQFNDDNSESFSIEPKSHDSNIEISGLMGFSVLREFFTDIDYRNGLLRMAYDFNHLYTIREMARDQ